MFEASLVAGILPTYYSRSQPAIFVDLLGPAAPPAPRNGTGRGGREAEGTGLLNRRRVNGSTEGSNPSLSVSNGPPCRFEEQFDGRATGLRFTPTIPGS